MDWMLIIDKILYILVSIVLYLVIKFLQDKGVIEKIKKIQVSDELKETSIKLGILYAQQVYNEQGGKVKYEKALEYVTEYLTKRGVTVDEDELKGLIEGNLIKIKDELSSVWGK